MSRASVEVSNSYFRRLIRPQVLSLEEYSPGPSPDYDGAIRISANENCFGAAPAVREAIIAQLNGASGVFRYPDGSCSALRERLSGKFGLPPEWFMAGNGLDDVISTIAATFLGPDDEVIIPAVSFVMYENAVRLAGAASVRTPMTQGLSIDVDSMISAVTSRTKMLILCNPNNPTGTITDAARFMNLVDALSTMPASPLLIVDQAYSDFVADDAGYPNVIGCIENFPNIMALRTFSKMSGMAGLRIGYAIAHPELISYMYRVRLPYTVNSLAQAAAVADLSEKSAVRFREETRESILESRRELEGFFAEEGVAFVPSQANFVFAFFDRSDGELKSLAGDLARERIFVRNLRHEGAPSGIRFSIGTREENHRLMSVLRGLLPRYRTCRRGGSTGTS